MTHGDAVPHERKTRNLEHLRIDRAQTPRRLLPADALIEARAEGRTPSAFQALGFDASRSLDTNAVHKIQL
jgi:hypothetical protein